MLIITLLSLLWKRLKLTFLLDEAKILEKVPHRRLKLKLECHELTKEVIDGVQAFLTDRTQSVKSGVPLGTCLGPTLFNILYVMPLITQKIIQHSIQMSPSLQGWPILLKHEPINRNTWIA